MIGTTIAHYRIEAKLGEGGMGEVYRARDTKLNRDVALKILPHVFAQDAQRMARFEREAQVLASLNHANIAQIYGLEETDGTKALVLELVEGKTLQEQIARGPIPVDEALKIALQICEGLEAAHEKGIIHRDLKPANIKITPEGAVKILDFGLAKALEGETPGADLSHSPTLTQQSPRAGVILGTAAYMSPEQARGKPVDRRTDIWAFGCVLYEMVTGKKAFGGDAAGETVSDVLASVLKEEPDLDALPGELTEAVRRLLKRCLDKDPKRRLRDVGDATFELMGVDVDAIGDSNRPDSWSKSFYGIAGVIAALIMGISFGIWIGGRGNPSETAIQEQSLKSVSRMQIGLPDTPLDLRSTRSTGFALSPAGDKLVFVGRSSSTTQLYLRDIDSYTITPIPGSQGATYVFFSPDRRNIGFLTGDQVKRVSLEGEDPLTLCDARNTSVAFWTDEDEIYFTDSLRGLVHKILSD